MIDIQAKIQNRTYQSPGRARAALARSHFKAAEKHRLSALIDSWENEAPSEPPVVGGVPGELSGELPLVPGRSAPDSGGALSGAAHALNGAAHALNGAARKGALDLIGRRSPDSSPSPLGTPLTVNLNARVRARLTPYGVSLLYAARSIVPVPADLLEKRGVWETELWQFMAVIGKELQLGSIGEPVTVDMSLEFLSV